jgi:predicted PurR-regulated permease PerM
MKRLAILVAVVLATISGVVLLWRFRNVAVLFIFSLVLAAAVRPPINFLVEHRWPRGLAMAATYLGILATVIGLIFLAGSPLLGELQRASDALATTYERFKSQPPQGAVAQLIAPRLPEFSNLGKALFGNPGIALAGNALGFTMTFFDEVSKVVLVLVLSIYWGADQVHFERLWLSLLPAEGRGPARNIWRSIETGVGAYVRSEAIQSLLAGLILGLGYWAIGMPVPVLLAFIGALAWLVPLLGGPLALIPVAIIGFLRGPWYAVAACGFTITVFLGLELVVERRLVDSRRYSPILVLVIMIAMVDVLGIVGLLVAPPLSAAVQIFFTELVSQPAAPNKTLRAATQMDRLRDRVVAARQVASELDGPPPPELQSLLDRLGQLVDEVDDRVGEENLAAPASSVSGVLPLPERERVEAHGPA